MRIVVLSGGGRGDAQPYAALACGFKRAGHDVVLATVPEFVPLVEGRGIELFVSDFDMKALFETDDAQKMFSSGKNPIRFMRHFTKLIIPAMEQAIGDLQQACKGADGLVLSSMSILVGTAGVERLGVPYVAAFPMPATPSRHYPAIVFPPLPRWLPGRRLYNRLTHWIFRKLTHRFLGRHHQRMMEQIPMPPSPVPLPAPVLYGFSESVFQRPSDWEQHVQPTGYWYLDRPPDWTPPEELQAFLDAGDPPVYVGFGSMNTRDPATATRLVCQALERAEHRGVLITGMGGLKNESLPHHVLALNSVPHDWLFDGVAAVVHHCGAGTTAAGLRAGRPTVCVPHMGDQFFWARRVHALGAGPKHIPRKRLTVQRLADAIHEATGNARIKERAAAAGEQIRSEDGVSAAVELAVRHFESDRARQGDTLDRWAGSPST
jgi:sterol 3beta-glucosyltransferase